MRASPSPDVLGNVEKGLGFWVKRLRFRILDFGSYLGFGVGDLGLWV